MKNQLELYNTFYDTYPDAVFVLQEGVIVVCNELAQLLFQIHDKQELINKKLSDFLAQKKIEEIDLEHHFKKCLSEGKKTFEQVFQNKKGELIYTKVFLSKIKVNESLIQVIVRDTTEQQKAEKQLEEQHQKVRTIIDALDKSAIISIADKQGKITKVNKEFCQVSQYSEQELLGKDHRIVNSGHHPVEFWQEMWRTTSRGKTWRADVKNKAKDGSFYWVDTVINPMLDGEGKIDSYLSIRYLVTGRKQQEFDLQANQEQLRTSEEELRQNLEELEAQRDYIQEINDDIKIKSEIIEKNS